MVLDNMPYRYLLSTFIGNLFVLLLCGFVASQTRASTLNCGANQLTNHQIELKNGGELIFPIRAYYYLASETKILASSSSQKFFTDLLLSR
jgi:hypothetical protein